MLRYEEGARPVDIAVEVGTSEWSVHNRLRRAGVQSRGGRIPESSVKAAVALREQGVPFHVIAERLGHHPRTIANAVKSRQQD